MGRTVDSRAASGMSTNGGQQQASGQRRNEMGEPKAEPQDDTAPEDYYISDLYTQLTQVIAAKPIELETLRIGRRLFLLQLLII